MRMTQRLLLAFQIYLSIGLFLVMVLLSELDLLIVLLGPEKGSYLRNRFFLFNICLIIIFFWGLMAVVNFFRKDDTDG